MNLRKNGGFTGVDVSIAIIIILIFVPTIFGTVYNIQLSNNWVRRESEALNIATTILETAKSMEYSKVNLDDEDSEFVFKLRQKYNRNSSVNYNEYYFNGQEDDMYKINVTVSNYYPDGTTQENKKDLIKKVKAEVTYPVGKNQKTLDMSTYLKK